jgi:hypothetical protein
MIMRGVNEMGLMYLTVIGYMVMLGLSAGFIMHFLVKAFDSSEATKIDPKPDTNY